VTAVDLIETIIVSAFVALAVNLIPDLFRYFRRKRK